MTWIKFEISTHDKPEVWQIAEAARIDSDAVIGKLLRVWAWFDLHTSDGNAKSVTKSLLDRLVGVPGFCEMMIAVGWMCDDGTTITLPNFDRHNGRTAKTRALTANRVSSHRKISNATTNDPVTLHTLPEKRREEKEKIRTTATTNHNQPPVASVVGEASGGGCGGRVLGRSDFATVPPDAVERLAGELSPMNLRFAMELTKRAQLARVVLAAGVRAEVLELVQACGAATTRAPTRYWAAGLKKIFDGAGVDLDASLGSLVDLIASKRKGAG